MAKDLNVGDIIQDNDPRMPGRKLTITDFEGGDERDVMAVYAICDTKHREGIRINVARIFTDGKARRYGFNRVRA